MLERFTPSSPFYELPKRLFLGAAQDTFEAEIKLHSLQAKNVRQ
jgi:hypothetical protein